MKTKLRRLVSILSAMVSMILCAFPAFADDTVTKNDLSSVKWNIVSKSSDIPHFTDVYNCFSSTISKTDNYIAVYGKKSDGTSETNILYFDPTAIAYYSFTNNQFLFGSNYEYDSQRFLFKFDSSDNKTESVGYGGWSVTKPSGFQKPKCRSLINLNDYVQTSVKVYFHTKIYDFDNLENELDPNAPPVPFTVDYSPALSEGMSRKGTLVAPGASNDGQEIESNGLNVRVTLTDEFLKLRDSYDELKDYTYEFVCYITTSPPEKSSYEESVKNAVYTSLDYGKYMYTTSGVVDDVTDDNKEPTEWIKAEGINAGYIIGKGGSVKNVTINLENLDSSQFTADTKLYIVVYGRLTSLSVPTPDYFDLDNQGYLCNQGSLNTKQIVTVNADPETGEGTDVVMPDYYCVTSTAFNYKDYPEYKPKIFKNGAEMDTNKPFTDYLDKKLTPDYMYDYDMDKNGESGLAPDDFEKYEEQKKLDANFGSFDFGLDSIKSVFDGTSDFFKFLTASISILPTTFLTILISFFVIMLVIVVAKWIIP